MEQNNLTPLRGKILCKILSNITKTESGLYLASSLKETPHYAEVLKVGKPVIRTCANCDMTSCNSLLSQKKWKWYKHKRWCSKRGKPMHPCCNVGDVVHFKKGYRNIWKGKWVFLTNQDIVGIKRR